MEPTLDELRERLSADPTNPLAYTALRAALAARDAGRELVELVERWAEKCSDPLEMARNYAEAGELREKLGDIDRAYRHYARAVELDARQAIAASGFVRVASELRDVNRQIEVLDRWAAKLQEVEAPARERGDAQIALARAWGTLPGRLDKAFEHYRNAIALDPELEPLLDEALDKARKSRRTQEVRSLLSLAADSTRVPERKVALLRALAEARKQMPLDLDGSIEALRAAAAIATEDAELRGELLEALTQRAQRRKGTDAGAQDVEALADLLVDIARRSEGDAALGALERALDLVPTHAAALALLEPIALERSLHDRFAKRLEAVIRSDRDAGLTSTARKKLATLHVAAGRNAEAYSVLEPMLVGAAEPVVQKQALDAAMAAGRRADALRLIPRVYEAGTSEQLVVALLDLLRVSEEADDLDVALDAARHILSIVPNHADVLSRLTEFHARRGEHLEERAVLERRLVLAADVPSRKRLLRAIVDLCDGPLNDDVAATDAFQKLAELDPRDERARDELLDRLERNGRLRAIADVRVWEITNLDSQVDRKRSLDALLEMHEKIPVDASLVVSALRTYRAKDPTDPEARSAMIRFMRGAGELAETTALLQEAVRAAPDTTARIDALEELAELLEEAVRDEEGAREACLHILELSPGLPSAVARLERIATRGGRRDRLIEALEHRAGMVDGLERAAVLTQLAHLHERAPADLGAAIYCWELTRELDPTNAEATSALLRLYAATQRHEDTSRLLHMLAEAADDPETRIEYLRAHAHLLRDVLGDADGAADRFREIRTMREDEEALEALIDHARASELHTELSQLLETRLASIEDAGDKTDLGMERATLLLDHLGDPREAERELLAVREVAPTFAPALARLAGIYADEGDWPRLAEVTATHLDLTTMPAQRAALARRLFGIYEREVPDASRALDAAREWVRAAPFDLDALRAVAERLDPQTDADELVRVLDARADELIRRIARSASDATDALRDEAMVALRESITTTVRHRDDDAHAETRLLRALELAYADELAVRELIALACELDAHAENDLLRRTAATYLARKATQVVRPDKERLYRAAADLFGGPLADVPRAFEVLRRALTECPDDAEILESVIAYGSIGGLEEPLLQLLGECFDASIDAKVARALQRERAELLYELGRYSEAADAYHRLSSMEPDNERARARHRECLSRAERYQDLLIALGQSLRRLGGETGPRRVALLRDTARAWDAGLGNRFESIDAWKAVLAAEPGDAEATAALERLSVKPNPDGAPASQRPSMPPRLASNMSLPPPLPEAAEDGLLED